MSSGRLLALVRAASRKTIPISSTLKKSKILPATGDQQAWLSLKCKRIMADAAAAVPSGQVFEITGDLLDATEDYIVHQTNCVSKGARGLAQVLFKRFPHADIYSERAAIGAKDRTGQIKIRGGPGTGQRGVIGAFGQFAPGKPRPGADSIDARTAAFLQCLDRIAGIPNITSVAFPFQIGSGLAGGDWSVYKGMIEQFAAENPHIRVAIYKLADAQPTGRGGRGRGSGGARGGGRGGRSSSNSGGRGRGGAGKSTSGAAKITNFFGVAGKKA